MPRKPKNIELLEQAAEAGSAVAAVQLDRAHGRRSREKAAERRRQERLEKDAAEAMRRAQRKGKVSGIFPPFGTRSVTPEEAEVLREGIDEKHWAEHDGAGDLGARGPCEHCRIHAESLLAALKLNEAGYMAVFHPGEELIDDDELKSPDDFNPDAPEAA